MMTPPTPDEHVELARYPLECHDRVLEMLRDPDPDVGNLVRRIPDMTGRELAWLAMQLRPRKECDPRRRLMHLPTLEEWKTVRLAEPTQRPDVLETVRALDPADHDVVRRILVATDARELDAIALELGLSAEAME
jgi:hypothetical protein